MRRVLAIVAILALAGLAACGKSKRERCLAMAAHHEAIIGTPIMDRDEYVDLCTRAAFDREIDCELAARTRDDLGRCAGATP